MKHWLLSIACFAPLLACAAEDNLRYFVGVGPHPVCGINPAFDGQPKNVPPPPFASCRTLAPGYGAEKSYPDPGVDALSKLIVALAEVGGWEKRFGPLNQMFLECRPAMPLGLGPMSPNGPASQWPICTVSLVQSFLARYDSQAAVQGFKKMERSLRRLDLTQQGSINKLKQAEAVVRSSGGQVTFGEVAELLE